MPAREDRFAGYRLARLRFPGPGGGSVEVHPAPAGERTGRFPFDGPVHVLTAHDPGPARLTRAENARRQRDLEAELPAHLRRWTSETGAADGSHTEYGVLVEGLTDAEAVGLAARYGQDAVFRWSPEAWSVLPCDGGPPEDAGWVVRR